MKKLLDSSIFNFLLCLFALSIFTVNGAEIAGGIPVNATATITWPFTSGAAGQTATYSAGTENYFSTNWVTNGTNLAYASTKADFGITFTAFQPFTQNNTVTAEDYVAFNIRPKTALLFTPTLITFDCERFGTGGGLIDAVWKSTDGTSTTLKTAIVPERNGVGTTHASINLSTLTIPSSNGNCALYLYIYTLGNTKQVGVSNVVVNGNLTGTLANIASYKLNATVSPAGAGTITNLPVGNEFDEGTSVTLTAATRSFGYLFKEWQDESGNVLASTKSYTLTMNSEKTVKAVYEPLTTYNFTVKIMGSNWGEVKLTPAPTNGKYEAGTSVSMEVIANQVTNFSYWEDNSTATTRNVTVDGDKAYTATFDEIPFITGWDFNPTTPNSSRGGDFYSETSNIGSFNVYKQDGTSTTWLGHAGAFSPLLPCSYLWTVAASFATDRRYWVATFSTIGYSNIKVNSQMAGSYQHYLTQKMQVSLDGTNYSDLKSINISTSVWTDFNATLPIEYENQAKIYVKWVADTNSTLKGNTTDNDGTAITNIFVFADKSVTNDLIAPTLISTVPAENTSNATANGSIVLTFDERMKVGTGDCTLGSTTLSPNFGSKTVSFPYMKLTYNTDYVFTVPSGALTDMAGNPYTGTSIHFKTMDRPQPIAKVFDAVIAKDGSGDYTTVQAAIDAMPSNRTAPWLIFLKNGTYEELIRIGSNKPFIHLIGQDKAKVKITFAINCSSSSSDTGWEYNKGKFGMSDCSCIVTTSGNFYAENITFENKYGVEAMNGPQALALKTYGDKFAFYNCNMRSFQDTWQTTNNDLFRHYAYKCRIEGAVDYIYNTGNVLVENSTLYNLRSGSVIVAPSHGSATKWGYAFLNCTIDGNAAAMNGGNNFGRPWHNAPQAVFINSKVLIPMSTEAWVNMGTIPKIFAEYNSYNANNQQLDLSGRKVTYSFTDSSTGNVVTGNVEKNVLTDEDAARYTYENIVMGDDGWNPRAYFEPVNKPENLSANVNTLSWNTTDYAISYVVLRNDSAIGFTKETSFTDTTKVNGTTYNYQIKAVNEYGSLSEASAKLTVSFTGVNAQQENKPVILVNANNDLVVSNIEKNTMIDLYTIEGKLVFKEYSTSDVFTASVGNKNGIFILKLNNKAYKIKF